MGRGSNLLGSLLLSGDRLNYSLRDVVAKAINSERLAGRASEHGGAYLDISWRSEEEVKKKLPGMYHQFKELAAVDITKQPMEVGPTAHYVMGGVKVNLHAKLYWRTLCCWRGCYGTSWS